MNTYRRYITNVTVSTTGVIASKVVTPKVNTSETDTQRHKRLKAQAAANRIRVTDEGNDVYTCTSQCKTDDGERPEKYTIVAAGATWLCQCKWHQFHPGGECAHVAQLREHRKRKGQSEYPTLAIPSQPRRARTEWTEEI